MRKTKQNTSSNPWKNLKNILEAFFFFFWNEQPWMFQNHLRVILNWSKRSCLTKVIWFSSPRSEDTGTHQARTKWEMQIFKEHARCGFALQILKRKSVQQKMRYRVNGKTRSKMFKRKVFQVTTWLSPNCRCILHYVLLISSLQDRISLSRNLQLLFSHWYMSAKPFRLANRCFKSLKTLLLFHCSFSITERDFAA